MREYEIERGQLDALWSYVGHKEQEAEEEEKRSPLIQKPLTSSLSTMRKGSTGARRGTHIDTRLRVGRGIAKTETEASEEVFQTLRQNRGHPEKPPPTISDGWGRNPRGDGTGLGEST
jgi:hypothetical protein